MTTTTTNGVDPEILSKVKSFSQYVEAKLGFRNHWYPVGFSEDFKEGGPVKNKLLGLDILLNRIDGKVYAIRDRCVHRGVPLSTKLECWTKDTITCWYHGFTYRFDTGKLVNIISVPNSKLIGKTGVQTYPVEEFKGIVFVFVGDADKEVPPLARDLPPQFLDPKIVIKGKHQPIRSNWRTGVENGWDSMHLYLHRNAELVRDQKMLLPLAMPAKDYADHAFFKMYEEADGPKGIRTTKGEFVAPVFDGTVEGKVVVRGADKGDMKIPDFSSVWLPGIVVIDPWPTKGMVQMEWYVPMDEDTHVYFQTVGKYVENDADRLSWEHEFNSKWLELALDGFNDDDIWARIELQKAYQHDTMWIDEQIAEPDIMVIRWRQLAHKHNRGIQRKEHLR
jgi:carbazole 1,9a-dioxygenase